MKTRKNIRLGFLAIAALASIFIASQTGPAAAQVLSTINGTLTVDDNPVPDANIRIGKLSTEVTTDANGEFTVQLDEVSGFIAVRSDQTPTVPDLYVEGEFDATTNRNPVFNIDAPLGTATINLEDTNGNPVDGEVFLGTEVQQSVLEGPWSALYVGWISEGDTVGGTITLPTLETSAELRVTVGNVYKSMTWDTQDSVTVVVDVVQASGTLTVNGAPVAGADMGLAGADGPVVTNSAGEFSAMLASTNEIGARAVADASTTTPAFVLDGAISTQGAQAIDVAVPVEDLTVSIVDQGGGLLDGTVSVTGEANSLTDGVTGFSSIFGSIWSNSAKTSEGQATLPVFERQAEITATVVSDDGKITWNGTAAWDGTTGSVNVTVDRPAQRVCGGLLVSVDLEFGESPTDGDDVIRGTSGDDVINALGGNDVICAMQGDDTVNGGDGFDKVFAAAGNDTLTGGPGNDQLVGGLGDDRINGGKGNDRLFGGPGLDVLNGGGGVDRIAGGDGNDTLRGGTHDDVMFGNLGRDQMFGDAGNDTLRGGAWVDMMDGGAGADDGCTLSDPGGLSETRVNCEAGVFGR